VCLSLGATGPLYAGYMLAGGNSWRLFFYVEVYFAAALFLLAVFFVGETTYDRKRQISLEPPISSTVARVKSADVVYHKSTVEHKESESVIPLRRSDLRTLRPWSRINHEAEFFMTMVRPFSLFVVPAVFWVLTTYGMSFPQGSTSGQY